MFDADRPIQRSEQDRLGRTVFAKYLARCILEHQSIESLVLGLYGSWGSGKTSIINLALEELRFASNNMFDQEKPIILNFSAWSYSGQDQLIYSFFRRLSSEMRQADYFENSMRTIHLLELYVSFFTHKPVPTPLRPQHNWFTRLVHHQKALEETWGWESGRDLTLVKAELNHLLATQKHKIIIFIDNISRLMPAEMSEIFQVIKSIGDFSNTVYVVAMDKTQVVQALAQVQGSSGEAFLEKIVQLPFTVPEIAKQDLEVVLLDRLKQVIAIVPEDSWDTAYWADIYYSALKYFFNDCRDITRYVNTLSFSFNHVKEVVNPVDFFAITALEVFEPQVFYGIRDNKDLFTDLMDRIVAKDKLELAEDKLRCDEILNRAENLPAEMLVPFLVRLFPRLRLLYQSHPYFYHSEALARQNKRICSPDTFDIYFRLTIPSGFISDAEMNAVLALASDVKGFSLALLRLNQDERVVKFLDLLDGLWVHKISTQHVPNVIFALMDSADLFPEGETTALSFPVPMRIHRILHQLLRRYAKSEDRFAILHQVIKAMINSIYSIVYELTEQGRQHIENEDTFVPMEHRDFTPGELLALRKAGIVNIIHWAETGRLMEHPKLLPVLYFWQAWGEPQQCERYVASIVREEKGLLAFLGAVLKQPINEALTMGSSHTNPEWKSYTAVIENFISPQLLLPQAQALFSSNAFEKLRDSEQLSLLIFLDLVQPNAEKIIPKTTA